MFSDRADLTTLQTESAVAVAALLARSSALLDQPDAFLEFVLSTEAVPFEQAPLHRELQAFLTAHSRAIIELPRDHGKTTQVCGRLLWELARNPRLRIKIVCATQTIATERCRFLREMIASNARFRAVCPHIVPGKPWSDTELTIERDSGILGPTLTAIGLETSSTGTRADLLICDDIVNVKSMYEALRRERVTIDFENNLLNTLEPDGRFWGLCTPWHRDDLNALLKQKSAYALFRRAIDDRLTPIWPAKWDRDALLARRREIGEAAFARGYRLIPAAEGEQKIRPEMIRFWYPPEPEFDFTILSIDPAVGARSQSDATAFVVLGRADRIVYCLDAEAIREPFPRVLDRLEEWNRRWNPQQILFESNSAFAAIALILRERPEYGFKIVSRIATASKESRIDALAVRLEKEEALLRGEAGSAVCPRQLDLFQEMTTFPNGIRDDLVDAFAAGVEHLRSVNEPRTF